MRVLKKKGVIISYVLVFGTIFLILLGGLLGFVLLQLRVSSQKLAWNKALQIAEAGVYYYRWCLNNEVEGNCQTEKEYKDVEGNPIGKFSLTISSKTNCGEVTQRSIVSRGWTYDFPNLDRKVSVLYGRESVAKYAYLINDNVWAGSDREIRGLYHSNGGIRMDGTNYSLVTSAQEEWILTRSFGYPPCPDVCHFDVEGNCICPGVFTTANGNEDLFSYPVPSFDFEGITLDLAQIKQLAQTEEGSIYLPPSTDIDPEAKGYHVIFKSDGSFEVWIITKLDSTLAYSLEEGWYYEYSIIDEEYLYNSYPIDPTCSLIFVEDNLWVEGEVKGKVTIASANLISPTEDTDVWLPGNIEYTALDGSDGLAVFGERNVLIGPDSPNIMTLRGIFIAQKGHFGRNHYTGDAPTKRGDLLTIYGSIVSNGRVGTAWLNPAGEIVSGYLKRENYVDSNLVYNPPPFVPYVSSDFKIVNWEEIE